MYNLDNYEQVPIGATIKEGAIYSLNVNSPLKFPVDKTWIGVEYKEGMYWVANPKPASVPVPKTSEPTPPEGFYLLKNGDVIKEGYMAALKKLPVNWHKEASIFEGDYVEAFGNNPDNYWYANPIEQPVTDLLREPAKFPDCEASFNPIQPDYYRNADGSDIIDAMVNEFGPKAAIYFCVGNSRKYMKRAGNKAGNSTEQDLKKANEFLSRAAMIAVKHLKD